MVVVRAVNALPMFTTFSFFSSTPFLFIISVLNRVFFFVLLFNRSNEQTGVLVETSFCVWIERSFPTSRSPSRFVGQRGFVIL